MHVVRAHDDDQVVHPEGKVDPAADVETIETELLYADLEQAERRLEKVVREARSGDKAKGAEEAWLRELIAATERFHARLTRLDREWRHRDPQAPSAIAALRERIELRVRG